MSEVKKIATRESYGNALAELGKEFDNLVVLDADLVRQNDCRFWYWRTDSDKDRYSFGQW